LSLVRKGAGVFLGNWTALPLQFLTGVLLARMLGAEGRGMLALFAAGITLLAGLGQFGLPNAAAFLVRREIANERTLVAGHLLVTLAFTLVIAGALFAGEALVWRLLFEGVRPDRWMIPLVLVTLPLNMVNTYMGMLALAQGRAADYARQTVGLGVLTALFTVALVGATGAGIAGGMLAVALANAVNTVLVGARLLRATKGQVVAVSGATLRRMLALGFQNYWVSIGGLVFKRIDTFLVQGFLGTAAVGYYAVARVPFDAVLTVPRALTGLVVGEASAAGDAGAGPIVARVTRNVLWLMLLAVAPIAAGAPWVVPWLYGADFAASVPSLGLLLAAAVLFGAAISLQPYFVGIGRPWINSACTLGSGVASVGLGLWLIPLLGIEGNALASLAGAALFFVLQAALYVHSTSARWSELCRLDAGEVAGLRRRVRDRLLRRRQPVRAGGGQAVHS